MSKYLDSINIYTLHIKHVVSRNVSGMSDLMECNYPTNDVALVNESRRVMVRYRDGHHTLEGKIVTKEELFDELFLNKESWKCDIQKYDEIQDYKLGANIPYDVKNIKSLQLYKNRKQFAWGFVTDGGRGWAFACAGVKGSARAREGLKKLLGFGTI